jgi:hypothetical protein
MKPACHLIVQLSRKLRHFLQFLVRHGSGHVINRLVPLVAENFELLYQSGICLDGEFQRFNGPGVVAYLGGGAIPGSPKCRCGCGKRGGKAGKKTKIDGNCIHLCISQTSLDDAL